MITTARSVLRRSLVTIAAVALGASVLTGCSTAPTPEKNPGYTTTATDSFPVTIEHRFGETVIPAEPQRVVVVGLTEQDVLLGLGVTPIATTEWLGEQPYAVWPWAAELLGDAQPTVLDTTDGPQYEKIASLRPDLIVGTNAGMTEEMYDRFASIAPTITNAEGTTPYASAWRQQTRTIARAVGRSDAGEALIDEVDAAYAKAASAHPEFEGLTATFSMGAPYDGSIYVYQAGLNTDFLTDLGFTITPGLEKYAPNPEQQALISGENMHLIDADVIVFATESDDNVQRLLDFGTTSTLDAVTGGHAVYTDPELAAAIYFMSPLSQKYVIDKLVPRLEDAVAGTSPQSIEG